MPRPTRPSRATAGRAALIVVGVAVVGYGVLLLVTRQDGAQVSNALLWLVGGVVLHDGLVAPVTIVLTVGATRLLPRPWREPATVALVVLGPLTLLAIPVLGSFGAVPDDPGLLERPYLTSWLAVVTVTVVAVGVAGWVRRAPGEEDVDGARPGR